MWLVGRDDDRRDEVGRVAGVGDRRSERGVRHQRRLATDRGRLVAKVDADLRHAVEAPDRPRDAVHAGAAGHSGHGEADRLALGHIDTIRPKLMAMTTRERPVSYTHLTLPTIYSV